MKLFFSDDYVAAGHNFDTTRKARWIADSLSAGPIAGVGLVRPRPLTRGEIAGVHAPEYVRAVETGEPQSLATSQGFQWDPGLWRAICASNGGAVAAALAAMDDGAAGSLSSGLHHARRERGAGFCTFNGLVLAARAALDQGAGRVLVLDLDAHCGGGTHELLLGDRRVVHRDVSVSRFDSYSADGSRQQLRVVGSAASYLDTVEAALDSAPQGMDLVIYNAGMDPFEDCDIGGLRGITQEILAERERMVFEWARACGVPIAFVLAGGYTGASVTQDQLVDLHRLTIGAAGRFSGDAPPALATPTAESAPSAPQSTGQA
jgi:acetoin utilization deacetylase AcuC-like enzyme